MLHWISQAFSTYVLHTQHGNGYQWWSGPGGDLAYIAFFVGFYKHINCEHPGCWLPGHRHPEHGRPVCRKHYHHDDIVPVSP